MASSGCILSTAGEKPSEAGGTRFWGPPWVGLPEGWLVREQICTTRVWQRVWNKIQCPSPHVPSFQHPPEASPTTSPPSRQRGETAAIFFIIY